MRIKFAAIVIVGFNLFWAAWAVHGTIVDLENREAEIKSLKQTIWNMSPDYRKGKRNCLAEETQ